MSDYGALSLLPTTLVVGLALWSRRTIESLLAGSILGLLIIPFAFFGMEYYTRDGGQSNAVATVNGSPVTQREFSEELRRQQERLRQAFGPNVDPGALDTPETRRALLESLISRRLLADAALRAGLRVSDDPLRKRGLGSRPFDGEGVAVAPLDIVVDGALSTWKIGRAHV